MSKFNNPFEVLEATELLLTARKPSVRQTIGNDALFIAYVGRIVVAPGSRAIFDKVKDATNALAKFVDNEYQPLTLRQLRGSIGSRNVAIMRDPRTDTLQLASAVQQMMAGATR